MKDERSIDSKFFEFHKKNPNIMLLLVKFAKQAKKSRAYCV